MSSELAPLYSQAIALPIFGFPAWILCVPPLIWQFRQGNIATGSLILWVIMVNFFLSVNSLIWPRDNIYEWWHGHFWCDINVRIQVGASVGTTGSAVMILRKLAKVMDTRNISVSSSRHTQLREKILEIIVCWGCPLILIIVYYIVQPARYFILGIVGCISAFDNSWPSVVLYYIWAPVVTLIGAGYAILLSYRLYRYRRDFSRLITARNTTKSRFIRLFILCAIIIFGNVPYVFYLLINAIGINAFKETYDWDRVHNPVYLNTILKVPSLGIVPTNFWGVIASGYVVFFIFGTGSDAKRLYTNMLLAVGLGKIFPALHHVQDGGSHTPVSFITIRSWSTNLSSKAKRMFGSQNGTVLESTLESRTGGSSVALGDAHQLQPVATDEPILEPSHKTEANAVAPPKLSLLQRVFHRPGASSLLPLFARPTRTQPHSAARHETPSEPWSAHAWASTQAKFSQSSDRDGVQIVKEVHQNVEKPVDSKNARISADNWA